MKEFRELTDKPAAYLALIGALYIPAATILDYHLCFMKEFVSR
jgi:hypothetical protein